MLLKNLKIKRKKKKTIKKLSKQEVNWLKGFNKEEIEKYMKDFPKHRNNTEEFKRKYNYNVITNKWKRK